MKKIIFLFILVTIVSCQGEKKSEPVIKTGDSILDQMTQDISDKPTQHELYYTRAKYLYEIENLEQALQDMQMAVRLDSTNADYYHLTSDILLDYYQSDNALKAMQKAVALYPQRTPSLLKLAELQLILKQYEPSLKTINDILAYDPQNAEAYYMLGLNFKDVGDMTRAINSFQTAVENDPELVEAWLILGELYESEKDVRALDFYNNAVLVAPRNVQALHTKAYYLQNHGEIEEAISIYDQIIEVDLHYKEAHLNKGILYLELKALDKAHEEFNILCKSHPTYHLGFYYRAIVAEIQGDKVAAKNDYQNAVNLKSDFVKAQQALDALNI